MFTSRALRSFIFILKDLLRASRYVSKLEIILKRATFNSYYVFQSTKGIGGCMTSYRTERAWVVSNFDSLMSSGHQSWASASMLAHA
jgi:hypothetical protein